MRTAKLRSYLFSQLTTKESHGDQTSVSFAVFFIPSQLNTWQRELLNVPVMSKETPTHKLREENISCPAQ